MTAAMKASARDIDHLTVTAGDPGVMTGRLAQLGFTLTPEGVEPRCVCFQPALDDVPNYIELMEGSPDGLSLAVNVTELEGEERSFVWETEDGVEVDVSMVIGEGGGPIPWLPVRHLLPDSLMEPEWIVHPNGALGLHAVHAIADDPRDTARQLKLAWNAESEEIFDGCVLVRTGAVELLIWSPAAWQLEYKAAEVMAPEQKPSIVGVTIAVERARPLQALLRANNVPFVLAEGDRVVVPAEQAGGLLIEFMPQT
jgi:hypothetical protein